MAPVQAHSPNRLLQDLTLEKCKKAQSEDSAGANTNYAHILGWKQLREETP